MKDAVGPEKLYNFTITAPVGNDPWPIPPPSAGFNSVGAPAPECPTGFGRKLVARSHLGGARNARFHLRRNRGFVGGPSPTKPSIKKGLAPETPRPSPLPGPSHLFYPGPLPAPTALGPEKMRRSRPWVDRIVPTPFVFLCDPKPCCLYRNYSPTPTVLSPPGTGVGNWPQLAVAQPDAKARPRPRRNAHGG